MKICIIGVYFGKLPNYFELWQKTCVYNSEIDFIIFTDAEFNPKAPNIIRVNMTLKEMKALAEKKIGMNLCLDTPFKCCDYKPVYGLIFEDFIKQYTYWGHCDFDMLFGDIMYFLKKYEIEKYHKFLPLGHLAFYLNTEEVNQRFRLLPKGGNSYKVSFLTPNTTQFDELGGINAIYKEYKFPYFDKRIFADISIQWNRIKLAENYFDSDDVNYPYQVFYWENGHIFRSFLDKNASINNEEYIYMHIKKRGFNNPKQNVIDSAAFYVCPHSFEIRQIGEVINKDKIQECNHYYGLIYEYTERILVKRVKGRISQIKSRILKNVK